MRFITLFAILLFGSVANASDPQELLQQAADNIIELLERNKQQLSVDETLAPTIVRENLLPLVDTLGLGKRLLTRKVWPTLSGSQQQRFTDAFVDHLINTYANGLANYDGHKFHFIKTNYSSSGKTAWVYSELISKQQERFSIIYTLKLMDHYPDWRVVDVSIEGIKILQNYREQLKSVDVSEGFDALLAKIEANSKISP